MTANGPAAAQNVLALFDQFDRSEIEFGVQPNSFATMPTAEAYGHWQAGFSFFNRELFQGKLPNTLITLTRHPRALGYFCAGAFQDRNGEVAHEISMNPTWFDARGDDATYSTLVHEMAHLWRHAFGRMNRKGGTGVGGYHDVVWAEKMEAVGLMPSDTGAPGGSRTGYQMTHYIIENGPFDRACRAFIDMGHGINWRDGRFGQSPEPTVRAPASAPRTRKTRVRFICPLCDVKAWSRASARLGCTDCDKPLVAR